MNKTNQDKKWQNRDTVRQKSDADWPYEDIVDLPHHVSRKHPQMEMIRRAAQFAPFAALTGYEDAVAETAKLAREQAENSR